MAVFVTVGTTSFNDLIREVNQLSFHKAIARLGYRKIFIQYGRGTVDPLPTESPLEVVSFPFRTNLDSVFSESSLVISHGGAGTCMEALTPPGKRKLIIIINETLMHNHQEELALSLHEGKHAFVLRVKELHKFISTGKYNPPSQYQGETFWYEADPVTLLGPLTSPESVGLVPFHRGDASRLVNFLNDLLGFPHIGVCPSLT
ncbi:unnamed protein product [Mesocestoides corti]|uniref:UDP-N-acetylglucosamine transferase subunit ALG13 n=1 Tax=Mesocestoides corti TaxID=53468 RepID=A0A0R3UEP8_MESCO|nr:unnamed protein product [Mesocestoides corti]